MRVSILIFAVLTAGFLPSCRQDYVCGVKYQCQCSCDICVPDGGDECGGIASTVETETRCEPLAADMSSDCRVVADENFDAGIQNCALECSVSASTRGRVLGCVTSPEPKIIAVDSRSCAQTISP